jgi:hypothetical protein
MAVVVVVCCCAGIVEVSLIRHRESRRASAWPLPTRTVAAFSLLPASGGEGRRGFLLHN